MVGFSWLLKNQLYHSYHLEKRPSRNLTSFASPFLASSTRYRIENIIEGGLANLESYVKNSAGTLLSASGPLICSLGIHPLGFIVLNQCCNMSMHSKRDHWQVKIRWKPSSHKKPRGNLDLEGDPVNKPAVSIIRNISHLKLYLTIVVLGSRFGYADLNWPIVVADTSKKVAQGFL